MKEALLDLIDSYKRRITALDGLLHEATDHQTTVRLTAKKSVYKDVIVELNHLIKDEDPT